MRAILLACVAIANVLGDVQKNWAFKRGPKPPVPPATHPEWAHNPIDHFIQARLAAEGMRPSPEADARTLLRRVYFDLHGLPPPPEITRAFLADRSDSAYPRLIDSLLDSPRHGERWARHWLDIVHFGETHGYDKDKPRPNAWPYRDYVIAALNSDKPYWRFVQEQVAGDVLFPETAEGVIATGFLAAGPWDFVGHVELPETKMDGLMARYNDRDDMVMNTMSTFMSLTVHCARCHDHKFDPIPAKDYYQLQAVFAGVDRADREYHLDPAVHQRARRLKEQKKALLEARSRLTAKPGDSSEPELKRLNEQLQTVTNALSELPAAQRVFAAANDFAPSGSFKPAAGPRPVHFLKRGEVSSPGELMQPGALSRFSDFSFECAHPEQEGERRAALARWLTHPRNLLSRRSIVNRVWQFHFGRGLADTPNDFGRMGLPPSHPELLDWLAHWFMENGESIKKLHRLILLSHAYRQSSADDAAFAARDTENRLLWRMNRTRLDAESLRDSMLAVSGKLDWRMGGPSDQQFLFKDDHSPIYDYTAFDVDGPKAFRRGIYRFIVRSVPDPFMDVLDCADPSLLVPKRNLTLSPLQALSTLNNPFAVRQADFLAERIARERHDPREQISRAVELALARPPNGRELESLAGYAREHGLAAACRIIFNLNEFSFVD